MHILVGTRNTWIIRHPNQITPATTVGSGFQSLNKMPTFLIQASFEEFLNSEEETQTHFSCALSVIRKGRALECHGIIWTYRMSETHKLIKLYKLSNYTTSKIFYNKFLKHKFVHT